MKTLVLLAIAMMATGCANMTPRQKQVAAVVGTVVMVGVLASHKSDSGGVYVGTHIPRCVDGYPVEKNKCSRFPPRE